MLYYICNISKLWSIDDKRREETRRTYWLFIHENKFKQRMNETEKKRDRESWLSWFRKAGKTTSRLMRACLQMTTNIIMQMYTLVDYILINNLIQSYVYWYVICILLNSKIIFINNVDNSNIQRKTER